jgi:dienelactone hydrolase
MSEVRNRALSPARFIRKRREQEQNQPNSSAPVPSGSTSVPTASNPVPNLVAPVTEEEEQEALDKNGGRATMLDLFKGKPGKGHVVSIHGINASPETMDGLHESAAAEGKGVHTIAMDDMGADLDDISSDITSEIRDLQQRYPGESITIQGHSMGGRLAADVARQLDQGGDLKNTLKLELFNPMLGGTGSGNWAKLAPGPLKNIPGVRPGVDMGSRSDFQKRLETMKLSPKVQASIKIGSEDGIVNADGKHFQNAVDGLNATVTEVPGAGHDDINDMANFRTP